MLRTLKHTNTGGWQKDIITIRTDGCSCLQLSTYPTQPSLGRLMSPRETNIKHRAPSSLEMSFGGSSWSVTTGRRGTTAGITIRSSSHTSATIHTTISTSGPTGRVIHTTSSSPGSSPTITALSTAKPTAFSTPQAAHASKLTSRQKRIIGIVIGCVVAILLVIVALWYAWRKVRAQRRSQVAEGTSGSSESSSFNTEERVADVRGDTVAEGVTAKRNKRHSKRFSGLSASWSVI